MPLSSKRHALNWIALWRGSFLLVCALSVFANEIRPLKINNRVSGGNVLDIDAQSLQVSWMAREAQNQPQEKQTGASNTKVYDNIYNNKNENEINAPIAQKNTQTETIDSNQMLEYTPDELANTELIKESIPEEMHVVKAVNESFDQQATQEPSTSSVRHSAAKKSGVNDEIFIEKPVFRVPPSPPVYPAIARRRGHEGLVIIDAMIDTNGTPRKVLVAAGSGRSSLDTAALNAVESWRFVPPKINGESQLSRVRIPVRFALR